MTNSNLRRSKREINKGKTNFDSPPHSQTASGLSPAWNKIQAISGIASAILVPILLGLVGYGVNVSLKSDELSIKYVEIAVEILKAPPNKEAESIREWAIKVLNEHSPVKLDSGSMKELLERQLKVRKTISDQLGLEEGAIGANTDLSKDLGADELDIFELKMALEEELGREINDEDFEKLNTPKLIVEYMAEKLGQKK